MADVSVLYQKKTSLLQDSQEALKRIVKEKKNMSCGSSCAPNTVICAKSLNLWYGTTQALKNINIDIMQKHVTALIGPSGCGKSTLIRCFNRMNDVIASCRVEGEINYHH
jgi:ABC-type multidrug transport system fused ATPase/permease subunit